MRGMPGFRHQPGVRRLPRPGRAGGSGGFASVPRLRCGAGPGGMLARDGSSRGVVTSVPCCVTVRMLTGRETPAHSRSATRSAARSFPAASSRDALRALQGALVGVQPATALAPRPGAQARRRRSAAGPCRHGAPASSLARSGPRGEASGLVTTRRPATGNRRKLLMHNVESGLRVTRGHPGGQVPGGARVQAQDFLREIHSAPTIVASRQRIGTGGSFSELEGCCISVLSEHKQMPLRWRC